MNEELTYEQALEKLDEKLKLLEDGFARITPAERRKIDPSNPSPRKSSLPK